MSDVEKEQIRTLNLPVKLTETEVSLRAQELATAEGALGDAEHRLEDFVEAAKATKKNIETEVQQNRFEVHRLAQIVREKRENREVPVTEEIDYEAGAVHTIRTDTSEVVSTRGMTADERQLSLFKARNVKKEPS